MRRVDLERGLFGLLLALWVLSFYLPPARVQSFFNHPNPSPDQTLPGLRLAIYSFAALEYCPRNLVNCYYGLLWLANIPMLLAPLSFRRVQEGRGWVFAGFLTLAAILPLSSLFTLDEIASELGGALRIGYAIWVIAIVGTASLFLWIASSRKRGM